MARGSDRRGNGTNLAQVTRSGDETAARGHLATRRSVSGGWLGGGSSGLGFDWHGQELFYRGGGWRRREQLSGVSPYTG
jgi:hypothetical protein